MTEFDYPGLVPGDSVPVRKINPVALAEGLPVVHLNSEIPADASFFCGTCLTKHVVYSHSFGPHLASFMGRLFNAQGPAKIADMHLTKSEYTNCAKARYWGLTTPHENEESVVKKGWWEITDRGKAFVLGELQIHQTVYVRDDVVLRFEGPMVTFDSVAKEFKYHADYADTVRRELLAKKQKYGS